MQVGADEGMGGGRRVDEVARQLRAPARGVLQRQRIQRIGRAGRQRHLRERLRVKGEVQRCWTARLYLRLREVNRARVYTRGRARLETPHRQAEPPKLIADAQRWPFARA